jgi:hypothetical protein
MEIDFAAGEAPRLGMSVVYKEGILPPTEDYTPFANGIKDAGANWVYSWAPWVTQIRTYEALRQIGWSGSYVTWAHTEAEAELERIKDPKLYVVSANALFADALPIQKEIVAAMNEAGSKSRPEQMTEGWIAGMISKARSKAQAPTRRRPKSGRRCRISRWICKGCAAVRSSGRAKIISASSNTIASITGTEQRSRRSRIGSPTR